MTWVEDVQQQRHRAGFWYPQQHIECGRNIRFTALELASQQIWEVNTKQHWYQHVAVRWQLLPMGKGLDVDLQHPIPSGVNRSGKSKAWSMVAPHCSNISQHLTEMR